MTNRVLKLRLYTEKTCVGCGFRKCRRI